MRGVVVRVEGPVLLLLVVMVSPVPVCPVVSPVLLSAQYLVHRPEHAVALPPRTERLTGVAGQTEALVVMVVVTVSTHLGVLTQLGQPDELLVEASVLLYLVTPPRDLHFDSVFLLLFKEMMFTLFIVASKRRRMPGSGAHLAAHG